VAVRGRLEGVSQRFCRLRVVRAELGHARAEQSLHPLVSEPEFGIAVLVQIRPVHHVEQLALLGGELHVAAGHSGQSLLRGVRVTDLRGQRVGEGVQRPDGHGREQLVAVGEVPVGRGGGDAQAPTHFGQGKAAHPPLGDQLYGPVHQGRLEVTVVVSGALRRDS
jgi:hypothetical protein